ncbi:MAG: PIN domain-containing protein [Candidatus Sulfotelmatobacter sp.]
MKWFFDTSVLIPAFVEDHKDHERCLAVYAPSNKRVACCATHSLAEVYAAVTRLPGEFRASPKQAMLFLTDIQEHLTIVSLESAEYFHAIQQAAFNGIVGGTIYDALLAACAIKVKAETIYTDNERHFRMFGPDVASRVKKP